MERQIASSTGRGVRRLVAYGAIVAQSATTVVGAGWGYLGATTHHRVQALANLHLNAPVVGTVMTPSGKGFWLVARDGGIFSLGDAVFYGSLPGRGVRVSDAVGMAATPSGHGYWIYASDGGVFSFGDAGFFGSASRAHLANPIVSMHVSATGDAYSLTDSAGKVYIFTGTAPTSAAAPAATLSKTGPAQSKADRKIARKMAHAGRHKRHF
jgi:hypothetical protein